MFTRGSTYIRHMEDLSLKSICPFSLRLEYVTVVGRDEDLQEEQELRAEDFFELDGLKNLFQKHPLVVPFLEQPTGVGLLKIISDTMEHIVSSLKEVFLKNTGMGGSEASWRAYQMELALEEMFYGHPISHTDVDISRMMGLSSVHKDSLTYQRGFLATVPYKADNPPPLANWTRDALQKSRIERLFPLSNLPESELGVLGEALVKILLQDLYHRNENIALHPLQARVPPGQLKGGGTPSSLAQELGSREGFVPPMVFGRAWVMLTKSKRDVIMAIKDGLRMLGLRYFPDLKCRDIRNTKRVTWDFKSFVELHSDSIQPSLGTAAAGMVGNICCEIEQRALTFRKNLDVYKEHGMPLLPTVQIIQIGEICENVPPSSSRCLPVTKGTHWTLKDRFLSLHKKNACYI